LHCQVPERNMPKWLRYQLIIFFLLFTLTHHSQFYFINK
jgi:hypothetical protein